MRYVDRIVIFHNLLSMKYLRMERYLVVGEDVCSFRFYFSQYSTETSEHLYKMAEWLESSPMTLLSRLAELLPHHCSLFSVITKKTTWSASEIGVSIPGRVIPKTQKMVLDPFLLNTEH